MPRALQSIALLVLCGIVAPIAGCTSFESIEQRQVRTDRNRMHRGEPLKYHKDTIALSEHAMAMRLDKFGGKAAGATPPKGAEYEFRPNPNARGGHPPQSAVQYGKVAPAANPARYGAVPGYDDDPPGDRGYVTPAGGAAPGRISLGDTLDEPIRE